MGTYLRARFGPRFVSIGQCVGEGEVNTGEGTETLQRAPSDSIDSLAAQVSNVGYLLDLRCVPPEVARWLQCSCVLGFGSTGAEAGVLEASIGRAFDLILYQGPVTPA